jgi:predicted RND superfamily exporter protein
MAILDHLSISVSRLVSGRPWFALILGVALIGACFAGARLLTPDFTYRAFFEADDPLRQQVETFEATFGNDDSVVLLIHNPEGLLNGASAEVVLRATERMWLVPDVVRVDSLSNYRWVRAEADDILVDAMIPDDGFGDPAQQAERVAAIEADRLIPDYLLSPDGKTTMVTGFARASRDTSVDAAPVIEAVRAIIDDLDDGTHEFHITGRLAVMAGMQESAQSDVQSILPFVVATIVILLVVAIGRPGAVFLTLLLIVGSVVSTMGASGWLGMRISNITAMVPQFVLAIGVASAMHVLLGYYRERNKGAEKREATRIALETNFVPTLLTALTTCIAFLSFTATNITAIANLGVMVAIGTIVAWLLTYLLVGGLLGLLPNLKLKFRHLGAPEEQRLEPLTMALVHRVARFRMPIVIIAVLGSLSAGIFATSNSINANPFRYFDESFWLRQSSDFAEAHLRGSQGMEVVLHAGAKDGIKDPEFIRKAEALQNWIGAQPFVARTVSVVDFIKQTNEALNGGDPEFYRLPDTRQEMAELLFLYSFNLPEGLDLANRVSLDNDQLRISVRWTLYDSAEAVDWANRIEGKAAELGLDAETTGKMLLFQRMNGYVSEALFLSLGIALVLISVLLVCVFRSARLGIASFAANALPLSVGAAVLTFAGRDFDTGAVVAISVCLGVAVDDTIHLLQAIRKAEGSNTKERIAKGLAKVLPAITLTTLILMIGFGTFMLGDFVPNQNFGLMAVTIIGAAWLLDVVFLPALLLMLMPATANTPTSANSEPASDAIRP